MNKIWKNPLLLHVEDIHHLDQLKRYAEWKRETEMNQHPFHLRLKQVQRVHVLSGLRFGMAYPDPIENLSYNTMQQSS